MKEDEGCKTAGEGEAAMSSSSQAEKLRQASAQGDADQVKALLEAGARIEPDLEGRTALHLASANGHLSVVKALINGGAKINALDAAGYSPLHQAATEGHEEVVKVLLKSGCHVDTQDELHGNTALHEAAWKGFSRTLETLCKHRANVYIKNNGGFTSLHLACQNGHNQCCRVLLLSACKPDIRNSYGDTPLHTAARYGHAGVLRILISAFANVNETNKNGDSALHISAAMGRNKLTRILLEAECDQKIKNNQGEMARDIAERKEFAEVVKLLDNPPVTRIPVQDHSSKKLSKKREKDSNTSQESTHKEKKDKHKKSKKHHKVHFSEKEKKGNISPYGCHMYPDMNYFPSIKLKSLPQEPLKNGEQYYADLAGNIKKGPRGIGYMCYCAPFFNHVEKKLDANKKELLDHIDSRNEDLKIKISHLEKRTHDQLFSLNQKMKESLAIERGDCAERIDRRLFRERRELEQQQERSVKALQSEMKAWLHPDQNGPLPNGHYNDHCHAGGQPLTRSKSEDLLSETNSNHNSISLLSSTVTGASRFTANSAYNRTYLNPAQCGTKPKISAHMPNVSRLRMRCMGYPELKRESRSEGDLTSCHTDATTDYNMNSSRAKFSQRTGNVNIDSNFNVSRNLQASQPLQRSYRWSKEDSAYPLWKNEQTMLSKTPLEQRDGKYSGFLSDASKGQNSYSSGRPAYCTKFSQDQNHQFESSLTDVKSVPVRTQPNGFPSVQGNAGKPLSGDRGNGLPHLLEHDGSSFV